MSAYRLTASVLVGILLCLGAILCCFASDTTSNLEAVRIGIFADLHAHDTDSPGEGKVMTNYAERLTACVEAMNDWQADAMVQLGDFVNGRYVTGAEYGDPARIGDILSQAEAIYAGFAGPRYHVLGNHDVYDLSKEEFLQRVDAESCFTSFDIGPYHFVILDAQYNKKGEDLGHAFWVVQGNIPEKELEWLERDLGGTDKPTVVCIHQRLDVDFDVLSGGPEILNKDAVIGVLNGSAKVIAVFQGHDHHNHHSVTEGIHYVTFRALVDETEGVPPSWARVTLNPRDRRIMIDGEGEQDDLEIEY